MRIILLVLLLLPCMGCSPNHRGAIKAALAECVSKAKAEIGRSPGQSDEDYSDSLEGPISDCMKEKGYAYYSAQPDCDGSYQTAGCFAAHRR